MKELNVCFKENTNKIIEIETIGSEKRKIAREIYKNELLRRKRERYEETKHDLTLRTKRRENTNG